MIIVRSHNGVPIRLTEERWQHITRRHVELSDERERVLLTIAQPEMIQIGDFGELLAIRFFHQTPVTSKYLIVAYREVSNEDGFILTAYFASRTSARRKVLWKQ